MDINAVIEHLGLNSNVYRLNQSVPPHQIIEWNGTDPQPTQQELESAWSEIEAHRLANEYKDLRQAEYPSLDDLIVALWEGVVEERMASVTALEALRQAVKTKYPKP